MNPIELSGTPMMTGNTKWTWHLDREFCSDPNIGVQLIAEILDHLEQSSWGNKDVFSIHMAMEEAVMNAIKHGNKRDIEKFVKVSIGTTSDLFWARVEDQGEGFDPEDVPDPTLEENIDKTCGRGVMLMKFYMDEVSYNDSGNVVEISKTRTGK